jgi:hypothetical protein
MDIPIGVRLLWLRVLRRNLHVRYGMLCRRCHLHFGTLCRHPVRDHKWGCDVDFDDHSIRKWNPVLGRLLDDNDLSCRRLPVKRKLWGHRYHHEQWNELDIPKRVGTREPEQYRLPDQLSVLHSGRRSQRRYLRYDKWWDELVH